MAGLGAFIGLAGSIMSSRAERQEGKLRKQASEYNAKNSSTNFFHYPL